MSESGYDILGNFPACRDALHVLKLNSPDHRELLRRYTGLSQRIARVEKGLEPVSDHLRDRLKKQRLHILDKIASAMTERPLA
jgi:uncharacterized protein YdcH (DUF465 family)